MEITIHIDDNGNIKTDDSLIGCQGIYKIKLDPMTEKQIRSYQQLKLYWAVVRNVVNNCREGEKYWNSVSKVDLILRIKCGHIKETMVVPCKNCNEGVVHFIPDSISYGECSHKKFTEFVDKAIQECADYLGTTPEILMANSMGEL